MDPDHLDRIFRALADPHRRAILDRLRLRPDQSLFELCAALAMGGAALTRQAVSQHLDMLERAGLVHSRWSGRTKLHRADPAPLREADRTWLARHLDEEGETE